MFRSGGDVMRFGNPSPRSGSRWSTLPVFWNTRIKSAGSGLRKGGFHYPDYPDPDYKFWNTGPWRCYPDVHELFTGEIAPGTGFACFVLHKTKQNSAHQHTKAAVRGCLGVFLVYSTMFLQVFHQDGEIMGHCSSLEPIPLWISRLSATPCGNIDLSKSADGPADLEKMLSQPRNVVCNGWLQSKIAQCGGPW